MPGLKLDAYSFSEILTVDALANALADDLVEIAAVVPDLLESSADSEKFKKPRNRFNRVGVEIKTSTTKIAKLRVDMENKQSDRSDSIAATLVDRGNRLEAYAVRKRSTVPPVEGKFVVAGQVLDKATGLGLPNVIVGAFDLDQTKSDVLGESRTDALGYYRIEYSEERFKDEDKKPETFIIVSDDNNKTLFTSSKSFVQKVGETATIDAVVDASSLKLNADLSKSISSFIDKNMTQIAARKRVINNREILRSGIRLGAIDGLTDIVDPPAFVRPVRGNLPVREGTVTRPGTRRKPSKKTGTKKAAAGKKTRTPAAKKSPKKKPGSTTTKVPASKKKTKKKSARRSIGRKKAKKVSSTAKRSRKKKT